MGKKLRWVQGNTLPLAVPLYEMVVIKGGFKRQAYEAPPGSVYGVRLVGKKTYNYECQVDGNVVMFTDNGSLPCGYYGVEVTVKEPNRNLRTFKCMQIEIVSSSDCMNLGDFLSPNALAIDSDVFIWAEGTKGDKGDKGNKGDKGDPLTYDDLTPAQKADLTHDCYKKFDGTEIDIDGIHMLNGEGLITVDIDSEGVWQYKGDNTRYPIAHPDTESSGPSMLGQRLLGYKLYEQVFTLSRVPYTIQLPLNAQVVEAHCWHPSSDTYGAPRYKPIYLSGCFDIQSPNNILYTVYGVLDDPDFDVERGDKVLVRYYIYIA